MPPLREQLLPELAFARARLGMSREEFMRQTPAEWEAVRAEYLRAVNEQRTVDDWRTARLCAVMAWTAGATDCDPATFMPKLEDDHDQTPEEMDAIVGAILDRVTKTQNG
jgi:hypothetical protein